MHVLSSRVYQDAVCQISQQLTYNYNIVNNAMWVIF